MLIRSGSYTNEPKAKVETAKIENIPISNKGSIKGSAKDLSKAKVKLTKGLGFQKN